MSLVLAIIFGTIAVLVIGGLAVYGLVFFFDSGENSQHQKDPQDQPSIWMRLGGILILACFAAMGYVFWLLLTD